MYVCVTIPVPGIIGRNDVSVSGQVYKLSSQYTTPLSESIIFGFAGIVRERKI